MSLKCNECGRDFDKNLNVCPNCGCPSAHEDCPNVNVESQSPRARNAQKWIFATTLLCLFAGGVYYVFSKHFSSETFTELTTLKNEKITGFTSEFIESVHKYDILKSFSEGLVAVKKDSKWGYIDITGKEIIPCKYDEVEAFSGGLAKVKRDGHEGYVNVKGEEVVPCGKYGVVGVISEGLAAIEKDGKWGFINTKGEEVIPCKYDHAAPFSERFAKVRIGDYPEQKYGFINVKGEEVVPCIYDDISSFSNGYAVVVKSRKVGLVNTNGKEIILCEYEGVIYFVEGLVAVQKEDKWGFIDISGKEIIPYKYDEVDTQFSEGFAKVRIGDYPEQKYGLVNGKGKEILPCKYDDVDAFSEGLARVKIVDDSNAKYGFVDAQGKEIISCKYMEAEPFSNGLSLIERLGKTDEFGVSEVVSAFIDTNGEEVFSRDDEYCLYSFSGGLAKVLRGGYYGYINKKGEEVISCEYSDAESFSDGLAKVRKYGKEAGWGYINAKGEEVVSCVYDKINNFSDGLAMVWKNKKYGFVNGKGEEIVPCKYDYVEELFSGGFVKVRKEGRFGYVNTKGEEIVLCQYDGIEAFAENGTACAKLNCGESTIYGFVDQFGNTTFLESDFEKRLAYEKQQATEEEPETSIDDSELSWIQGNWRYRMQSYGEILEMRVGISGDVIVVMMNGKDHYIGNYTIEGDHLVYDRHNGMSSYLIIDRANECLKASEDSYMERF